MHLDCVGTSHISSLDWPESQESFLHISLDAERKYQWLNTNLWFYVAVLCQKRRVKAAKTRMRRYAQRCWKARLKPKVDCKRNQIHVYNHAAVWTRLSGGHGGAGSFATKKRREHQQQQANLADVLQNTLNQWMQSQRAPKRQKATAQDCCSDTSLLSILEATLADCKKHKRDDMAVAHAVQEALTSHQQERQTFYPNYPQTKKQKQDQTRRNVPKTSEEHYSSWGSASTSRWWKEFDDPDRISNPWQDGYIYHEDLYTQPAKTQVPSITELRVSERTMKPELVHLQTLKQSLTNGGPIRGNIMHISSRPQLNESQGLIAAHGLGGPWQ